MDWRVMPSLPALRAFAALAQTGSVSRAGELLNVTHAAVSQQMRLLEGHLGTPLIARQGRGVVLTPEGMQLAQVVLPAFEAIFHKIEQMSQSDLARPLQISASPLFTANWLMPRLSEFRAKHPEIDIMLNPTAEVVDLRPGGVDLAIRFGAGVWTGLDSKLLFASDFVVVAASDLVKDRNIASPQDLLDLPWLQEIGTNEVSLWFHRQGLTDARVPRLTQLPGNYLLEALRRGEGVSPFSRAFIQDDVEAGRLSVLFDDPDRSLGYHIVTRPGVQRKPLALFVKWLNTQLDENVAE